MGGKTTPCTGYRVTRLEPGKLMLWQKVGGTWLWLLEPAGPEHTRLITRMRGRYGWAKPTIVTELILMEIGDPFMMPKCLLGIKQRTERLGAERRRRIAGTGSEHASEAESSTCGALKRI
jgi:hypothetical protein